MVELVGNLELSAETSHLGLVPMLFVEHFQCDRAIGARGVMGPVDSRVPAMPEGGFNDIALKPIAGRKHSPRLEFGARTRPTVLHRSAHAEVVGYRAEVEAVASIPDVLVRPDEVEARYPNAVPVVRVTAKVAKTYVRAPTV